MTTKERINETENRSIEIIQFKEHRKQLQKKNEYSMRDNIKWPNIYTSQKKRRVIFRLKKRKHLKKQ